VPTISDNTDFAREGVLVTYGLDLGRLIGGTAYYIDKLLRGAKPADLPLQQPTKFDMAINLKTANALGISVPQSVVFRADEVIE
jgi:putative ABC transport system substrate-binding protein